MRYTSQVKKFFLIVGIAVLTIFIGLAGYVVFLQIFPRTVNESRDDIPASMSAAEPMTHSKSPVLDEPEHVVVDPTGTFMALGPHTASGRATLIKTEDGNYLRLEDDFSVTNGPDLFVYVGNENTQTEQVAVLKGTKGGQNYKLPDSIDTASFDTVWIYCKRFSTPFAKAKLAP